MLEIIWQRLLPKNQENLIVRLWNCRYIYSMNTNENVRWTLFGTKTSYGGCRLPPNISSFIIPLLTESHVYFLGQLQPICSVKPFLTDSYTPAVPTQPCRDGFFLWHLCHTIKRVMSLTSEGWSLMSSLLGAFWWHHLIIWVLVAS